MKKTLLTGTAALFLATGAAYTDPKITTIPVKPTDSVPYSFMILPPPEYDHEYDGDLTLIMVDTIAELRAYCKLYSPQLLACSAHNAKSCVIVMVNDTLMRRAGWTGGLLLRHERGHCNGWSGDHPGLRPLITTTHWVPENQRIHLSPQEQEDAVARAKKAARP